MAEPSDVAHRADPSEPEPPDAPEHRASGGPGAADALDRDGAGGSERLTRQATAHVALLARLALSDEELDCYAVQLASVLEHAAQVAAVDTTGRAPTAHPFALVNVLRPDEPTPSLDPAVVLEAAPAAEDGRFRVPRILGEAP